MVSGEALLQNGELSLQNFVGHRIPFFSKDSSVELSYSRQSSAPSYLSPAPTPPVNNLQPVRCGSRNVVCIRLIRRTSGAPTSKTKMDDLVDRAFFGFDPEQVYDEVYAICYNEFLQAAKCLRDTLLQVGAPLPRLLTR